MDKCPYCGAVPMQVSAGGRTTAESWYCPICSMNWSGPRCRDRHESASPITHAAMFAVFAKMVKRLRTLQREENVRFGYPLASITGMRLEGRIEGYTRVLELICPDPLND